LKKKSSTTGGKVGYISSGRSAGMTKLGVQAVGQQSELVLNTEYLRGIQWVRGVVRGDWQMKERCLWLWGYHLRLTSN
jgi:hypothetical protein